MQTVIKKIVVKKGESRVIDRVWRFEAPGIGKTMEYRAVVEEGGKLEMRGKICVGKKAVGTEAYLKQKVMLLGEGAVAVVAQPELEIECEKVKVSHATSVGPVDQNQLCYLMMRGWSREEGVKWLIKAFLL